MLVPNRNYSSPSYRYGFQGQEKDDEVKGSGNSINYKYRMHDPRVGRFFAIDPLSSNYAWNSPYSFSVNRVIDGVELEGLEFKTVVNWWDQHQNGDWYVRHTESFVLEGENLNYNVEEINYVVGVGYINKETYVIAKSVHGGVLSGIKTSANYNYTDPESISEKKIDDEAWVQSMAVKHGGDPLSMIQYHQVILMRDLTAPDNQIKKQNLTDLSALLNLIGIRFKGVGQINQTKNFAGNVKNMNKGAKVWGGGKNNCVNCAIGTDLKLAGRANSALPMAPFLIGKNGRYLDIAQPIAIIEKTYNKVFKVFKGMKGLKSKLSKNGDRAIIYGKRADGSGHVFNAVNKKGKINLIDGQAGGAGSLKGYTELKVLKTN